MKKIYQTPKTEFFEVKLQQMIAASILTGNAYSGGTIQSRGGQWDDEEEDEWEDDNVW